LSTEKDTGPTPRTSQYIFTIFLISRVDCLMVPPSFLIEI
jgi:hypothetical protein